MAQVTVVSAIPLGMGWSPGQHLVDLIVTCLDAALVEVADARPAGALSRLVSNWRARDASPSSHTAICVIPDGHNLSRVLEALRGIGPVDRTALLIFDSFRTGLVERHQRRIDARFDVITYMQAYDRDIFETLFGQRALWFPCGTDALNCGTATADRPIDVLRVGRQPASWDDDAKTDKALTAQGLRFQGRPTIDGPPRAQIPTLMQDYYGTSKVSLAFTNLAAPARHTHPVKEHLTGRWTDALACGCIVAGIPPRTDMARIDWPEALFELPSAQQSETLHLIRDAVATWSPEVARRNHLGALRHLDWRWSIRDLAKALDLAPPTLGDELDRLTAQIAQVARGGPRLATGA